MSTNKTYILFYLKKWDFAYNIYNFVNAFIWIVGDTVSFSQVKR